MDFQATELRPVHAEVLGSLVWACPGMDGGLQALAGSEAARRCSGGAADAVGSGLLCLHLIADLSV